MIVILKIQGLLKGVGLKVGFTKDVTGRSHLIIFYVHPDGRTEISVGKPFDALDIPNSDCQFMYRLRDEIQSTVKNFLRAWGKKNK